MFYLYTIFVPILLLLVNYIFTDPKPKTLINYVGLFLRTSVYLFAYAFMLYFLETEDYIDTSWAFYSILFFLVPVIIIALLIKVFYWIKGWW